LSVLQAVERKAEPGGRPCTGDARRAAALRRALQSPAASAGV